MLRNLKREYGWILFVFFFLSLGPKIDDAICEEVLGIMEDIRQIKGEGKDDS